MSVITYNEQVLELEGKLYSGNVTETQMQIEFALDRTSFLILNLSPLSTIDVAGAFMIYLLTKRAEEKSKQIILVGCESEKIKETFCLAGLNHLTQIAAAA